MARHGIGPDRKSVWGKLGSVVATLAMVATGAVVIPTLAANADPGDQCVPGGVTSGPGPKYDSNLNVYVGGDYTFSSAAELEGGLVVNGTMNVTGSMSLGFAGGGSGQIPPANSTALRVGGNVNGNGASTVHFASSTTGATGDLPLKGSVGGTVTPANLFSMPAGGSVQSSQGSATALGDYASWSSSGYLSTFADNALNSGAVEGSYSVGAGGYLVLTGTAGASRHIFNIPATWLTANEPAWGWSLDLEGGIDPTDPVIVNVTGAGSATLNVSDTYDHGSQVQMTSPRFGQMASQILWVFGASTDVTLKGAQVPGSVVVPTSPSTTTMAAAGSNGRIWVAGNLVQTGAEIHSYGFIGNPDTNCNPPGDKTTVTPSATGNGPTCAAPTTRSITLDSKTGLTYQVVRDSDNAVIGDGALSSLDAGTYTVTATITAADAYEFGTLTDGWSSSSASAATKTITLAAAPTGCTTTVIPADVTFTEQCGVDGDGYTVPVTVGVDYKVGGSTVAAGFHAYNAGDTLVVTAVAQAGYVLDAAATTSWSYTFTNVRCGSQVEPVAPDAGNAVCTASDAGHTVYGTVTVTDNSGNATYVVSSPDSDHKVTITATATGTHYFGRAGDKVGPGQAWTVTGDGTTAEIVVTQASQDCVAPVPAEPQAIDAQCDVNTLGDVVWSTVHATAANGISYTTSAADTNHKVTVTATLDAVGAVFGKNGDSVGDGWTVADNGHTASKEFQLTSKLCGTTAQPATPVETPAQCDATTVGTTIWSTVDVSNGGGISYATSESNHVVTITATITVPDVYFGNIGDHVNGWTVVDNRTTAQIVIPLQQVDCPGAPTLVTPTLGEAQCTAATVGVPVYGTVTTADVAPISYSQVDNGDHTVTVTASVSGDVFFGPAGSNIGDWTILAGGQSAEITVTQKSKACAQPTPAEPDAGEAQCTVDTVGGKAYSTVVTPVGTAVTYSQVDNGNHTVTVTATAPADTFFGVKDATVGQGWTVGADGTTATKTFTLTSKDCDAPAPAEPTVGDAQCTDKTVGQTVWSTVTTTDGGGITYGSATDSVTHVVTVTATVTAKDVFFGKAGDTVGGWLVGAGGTTATKDFQLASKYCPTQIFPVTPGPQCVAGAPTLPLPTDGRAYVSYTVDPVAGGYAKVTATITDAAYIYGAAAVADGWTVDDATHSIATKQVAVPSNICPTVTTPPSNPPTTSTSTPSTVTPAVDGTQCISVGSINELTVTTAERNGIVYTVRGNGSGKVTITATAKDGFELNVPTGWTRDGNSATITVTPASDGVICVAGESSVVPSASTSVTVVQPSVEVKGENNEIAYTGVNTIGLLSIALLLLGGGAIILGFGTGRRTAKREH